LKLSSLFIIDCLGLSLNRWCKTCHGRECKKNDR
jgi:hypothetical protein